MEVRPRALLQRNGNGEKRTFQIPARDKEEAKKLFKDFSRSAKRYGAEGRALDLVKQEGMIKLSPREEERRRGSYCAREKKCEKVVESRRWWKSKEKVAVVSYLRFEAAIAPALLFSF